jgi:hypothetical protein
VTEWRRLPAAPRAGDGPRWGDIAETLDLDEALDALGLDVVTERRGELWAYCPLDSHPGPDRSGTNFSVNRETMIWNCFTCAEGGGLPALVAHVNGYEDGPEGPAWQQALRWLAEFSDDADPDPDGYSEALASAFAEPPKRPARAARPSLPAFPPGALSRYGPAPLDLLGKWHIDEEWVVDLFQLKYDAKHGRHGYVGPALIIPHFFRGRLVGYQERWLADDRPKRVPKYTNTDEFPKRETLFGWDNLPREGTVVVVESAMTVISLACAGVAAVGTFGASVSDGQKRLLGGLDGVALAYDSDRTGERALRELADELAEMTPVDIVPQPPGDKADLADLPHEGQLALLDGAYRYTGFERIKIRR